jgi:hypothetical protein
MMRRRGQRVPGKYQTDVEILRRIGPVRADTFESELALIRRRAQDQRVKDTDVAAVAADNGMQRDVLGGRFRRVRQFLYRDECVQPRVDSPGICSAGVTCAQIYTFSRKLSRCCVCGIARVVVRYAQKSKRLGVKLAGKRGSRR